MMTMLDIGTSGTITMSSERTKPVSRQRKRKLYDMSFDFNKGGMPGYSLDNLDRGRLGPPPGQRGFPNYPEPPRFLFDKRAGDLPSDLEQFDFYWLVSDRTKSVFQAVDPSGFDFIACEVRVPGAEYDGPAYWLCDVVRVLDALDEAQSRLKIGVRDDKAYSDFGKKYYSLAGGAELAFREDAIGGAHVFRMAYLEAMVICDQALKDACKVAGLKGIRFKDALKF